MTTVRLPAKRKYRNRITYVDNIRFDSAREASRYLELKLLEKFGAIRALVLQPSFDLWVETERVCAYRGDFSYLENGKLIVEDVKGVRTAVYRLKKRLMKILRGIEIKEV